MNRKSLFAAAFATAFAGGAFADDITIDTTPFVSTATRAEVRAELDAHRQAGNNPASNRYDPFVQFEGQRSRAAVTAEYISARDRVAAFTGEDSGSAFLTARYANRPAQVGARQPQRAE